MLARWEVADLAAELADPWPVCFVLTNSRSLPEPAAARLNREIATNLGRHVTADGAAIRHRQP